MTELNTHSELTDAIERHHQAAIAFDKEMADRLSGGSFDAIQYKHDAITRGYTSHPDTYRDGVKRGA